MKTFRRLPKVVWTENTCTLGNDHVYIGKDDYLLSGDGYLMPVKKGQQPPDLRYFKQSQRRPLIPGVRSYLPASCPAHAGHPVAPSIMDKTTAVP